MMSPAVDNLKDCFKLRDGFPRPQWKKLKDRIRAQYRPANEDKLWTKAALKWLEQLKKHVDKEYKIYETDNFLLLAPLDVETATCLLQAAEKVLEFVNDTFSEIAKKPMPGKLVGLCFSGPQSYYKYLSHFYQAGEYGASSGVFVSKGCSHFVLIVTEQARLERTLAHELTHALFYHKGLPQWLDEGLSQLVEEAAISRSGFLIKRRDLIEHKKFWKKHGLDIFWSGNSFNRPDTGQSLSYVLSQVIVRNMLSSDRNRFTQFLRLAKSNDYGEDASRTVFMKTLGDWAAQFLGDGDWDVNPSNADVPAPG